MINPENLTTASVSIIGAAGTGTTYWLNQINPWLAFISGILTIVFMSCGIFSIIKDRFSRK
jgi:hypothetical protein